MATGSEITTELPVSQDWRDILAELLPAQGSWSEQEYLVLTDHRSRLIEFTDGFLEVLPMPTDKHQRAEFWVPYAFLSFIEPRGESDSRHYGCEFDQGKFREPDLLL